MNKRTFLQRLASTVAAIALAPALCRGIGRLETYQEPSTICGEPPVPGWYSWVEGPHSVQLLYSKILTQEESAVLDRWFENKYGLNL